MTTPYYVVASRLNSLQNNSTNNAEWEYKLNEGIELPRGTTVQVVNAYLNKQGITSNSIEFNEDKTETFQIGYTIPHTVMWQQKPERTAKDDRLLSASLEDNKGGIGLQTAEISIPLTNYYDCMKHHNPVKSDGMNLFNSSLEGSNILVITTGVGNGILIAINGDYTSQLKHNMPIVFQNLSRRDLDGNHYNGRPQALFCRRYLTINTISYDSGTDITGILTEQGRDYFIQDGGLYASDLDGKIAFPDINYDKFSLCSGVGYINSLIGTSSNGSTMYEQTKLSKSLSNYENANEVLMLENQVDNIQYQAGIRSDLIAEEFRKQTADYTRNNIWNASQNEVKSYQFDRGSYSFYFAPTKIEYDSGTSLMVNTPAYKTTDFDFGTSLFGLNGHGIRQNANSVSISKTGYNKVRKDYKYGTSVSEFFPYLDSIELTEYPYRKDLSLPKPAQPAKFKDTYSPQVDYLENGFSYDNNPARVEIFSVNGISMINTLGENDPFQPYIYQNVQGVSQFQTDVSTVQNCKFLDRVLLSQSMISGYQARDDSYAYLKRTVNITTNNLSGLDTKILREGTIIYGRITNTNQTSDIRKQLFPARQFRGELDNSSVSTNNIYETQNLEIPFMITNINNEGLDNAELTDLQPLTNLSINGAVVDSFTYNYGINVPINLANSSTESFSSFDPYTTIAFGSDLELTISSETSQYQNPQYIQQFSAKGCYSELQGDNYFDSVASDNDVSIEGVSARLNYFIDSMHDQTKIDFYKAVGEDYAINPNHTFSQDDFVGRSENRVCSHPYFNHQYTDTKYREDHTRNKRLLFHQRGNSDFGGIHPKRQFTNLTTSNGLSNHLLNLSNLSPANYLFGSTRQCSQGGIKPPSDRDFEKGSIVMMSTPLDDNNLPQPENKGIDNFYETVETFEDDNPNNVLNLKTVEQKAPTTIINGIFPNLNAPVAQDSPAGEYKMSVNPSCASALGDSEFFSYSTPSMDLLDTGGSNNPLCLVQLQAIEEDFTKCRNDYILRPFINDVSITIPKGVYSIPGFLDLFNDQIKNLNQNNNEELSSLDNMKTVRKFKPLSGNSLLGGQVSLLNDFNEETHNRTIFSEDPESEFMKNPLVIAIKTQDYNDLVRAWQSCFNPNMVSSWLAPGQSLDNSHQTVDNLVIQGGSYVWFNFRDLNYWAEFVDCYDDSLEDLLSNNISDVENNDTQFYFARNRNLDDAVGAPFTYGAGTVLGLGDDGTLPTSNSSSISQIKVEGNIETKIDKLRKYNSLKNGIYVGAPNFNLSYDNDKGVFSFSSLHYSYRNPTLDLIGENAFPENAIDQPSILYRSVSQLVFGDYTINNTDYNPADYIKNALQSPQDNISQCFIYNMSKETSLTKGDFIDTNSVNTGRIYNDYFTTNSKASKAWENTLWFRLGFAYETFNTPLTNQLSSYYFNVNALEENIENPFLQQTDYFKGINADYIATVKVRNRQALCTNLLDGTAFNNVSNLIQDNYVPGKTTSSNFDIRAIPQISSGPGIEEGKDNQLARLYNNASISTTKSMSGGYVNFPLKLGTHNSFNINVNYTLQNISSPGEAFIYSASPSPKTAITKRNGVVVPPASQIFYNRSYEFQSSALVGYNPTSFYQKTFDQIVDGSDYPVSYSMNNYANGNDTPFLFTQTSDFNLSNGTFRDRNFTLNNSMLLASQTTSIEAQENDIIANNLPTLTTTGFLIISSDIVDKASSIKESDNLAVLGTIPLSSLSSQDFITSFNSMVHQIYQPKIINSIKIKIMNPDLTLPQLQSDSTIVFQINVPSGTVLNLPTIAPVKMDSSEKEQQREDVGEVN